MGGGLICIIYVRVYRATELKAFELGVLITVALTFSKEQAKWDREIKSNFMRTVNLKKPKNLRPTLRN